MEPARQEKRSPSASLEIDPNAARTAAGQIPPDDQKNTHPKSESSGIESSIPCPPIPGVVPSEKLNTSHGMVG
jgi:hypothetical protein